MMNKEAVTKQAERERAILLIRGAQRDLKDPQPADFLTQPDAIALMDFLGDDKP